MIDSFDKERFQESRTELDTVLADEYLLNCPILILGNKVDKIGTESQQKFLEYFKIEVYI